MLSGNFNIYEQRHCRVVTDLYACKIKTLLKPFSLELRDITQDTVYVMNFGPCDPNVFMFSVLTEVVDRGQQICNQYFLEIQSKSLS